jgi:hypothetical protein
MQPATHDDNRLSGQAAGAADLEERQVGVPTDGDERRPGVKAPGEQVECSTRRRRPRSDVCRPMPFIIDGIRPVKRR